MLQELVQKSPIRTFEKSINGPLENGELGVIAAPSGIGKTAVLVQIALDKLMQDKKIIHISFSKHTDRVLVWYKDLLATFFKKRNITNEDDLEKNRVLLKFNQEALAIDQVLKSIRALMKDGGFSADSIIVDGLDFSAVKPEHMAAFKAFAVEMGVSIWYSCTFKGEAPFCDKNNIPLLLKGSASSFEVIVVLEPKVGHIDLTVSRQRGGCKAGSSALKLDPKTLILEN